MKRFRSMVVVAGFVVGQAGAADAALNFKKGRMDMAPSLGVGIGVSTRAVTTFKIGSDFNYMTGPALAFCGTLNFGLASGIFDLELAPGIKYRIPSLYKHNVDLGIKGQVYFDLIPLSGFTGWGAGVKFGPSFRYFFTDTIGAGMDFNFKLGVIKTSPEITIPGSPGVPGFLPATEATTLGGTQFGVTIDVMFGMTAIF